MLLFGLVFGLIRQKTNTTTSAIVHGMLNSLRLLLAVAASSG